MPILTDIIEWAAGVAARHCPQSLKARGFVDDCRQIGRITAWRCLDRWPDPTEFRRMVRQRIQWNVREYIRTRILRGNSDQIPEWFDAKAPGESIENAIYTQELHSLMTAVIEASKIPGDPEDVGKAVMLDMLHDADDPLNRNRASMYLYRAKKYVRPKLAKHLRGNFRMT